MCVRTPVIGVSASLQNRHRRVVVPAALTAAVSVFLVLGVTTSARAQDRAKDEAALRALNQAAEEAWNRGDPDGWVAFAADDAVYAILGSGETLVGKAARRAQFAKEVASRGADFKTKIHFELVNILFVGPDQAVTKGGWTTTGAPPDSPTRSGVFTAVFRRANPSWILVQLTQIGAGETAKLR